jgi:LPS-assembly protein
MPRQGDRLILNPRLTYNYSSGGFFIRPSVSAHETVYSLDETADPAMKAPTRFLPTLSIDSGLIFERDASLFGNAAVQTLEPRLFYTRTPYKRQDSLLYPIPVRLISTTRLCSEKTVLLGVIVLVIRIS